MRDVQNDRISANRHRGFTLIELVIVMAIIGILAGIGINSSMQFNRSQVVEAAARDYAATLQSAKSRAASQVKPTACGTNPLLRYQVVFTSATDYRLQAVCTPTIVNVGTIKKIPTAVSFPVRETIAYDVLTGDLSINGVKGAGKAYIFTGNGVSKTVTAYRNGRIGISE